MKRLAALLLGILLMFSLCACAKTNATYKIEKDGIIFEVDASNGIISDGTHAYGYTFSGTTSSYNINITYPNGSTYYWNQSGNTGHGGWSDGYDETLYADGNTLCDVITEKAPKPSNPVKVAAIVLLIGIGGFNIASPHTAWYLEYGWRFKNAEPSDTALVVNRIGGAAAILIAVILIFI